MNDCELLKHSRKKLDWTQQDLADYFEISQRVAISYWEQGERPIPKKVLKMAKQVKRMSKKDAKACYIPSGKKSQKKVYVAQVVSKCDSLHSLEENFTPNPPVSDTSGKFPEDSMERYILESYITFKKGTGRFPTTSDFVSEVFKEVTRKEALKYFGSLREAKKLASELMRSQRRRYRKKKLAHALKPISSRRNVQTVITYVDSTDKYNWLRALYPNKKFNESEIEGRPRNFTWEELWKYRPESERLVAQVDDK